jgi:hypothetical protein
MRIIGSLKFCENPRIGGSFISKIKNKKTKNYKFFTKDQINPPQQKFSNQIDTNGFWGHYCILPLPKYMHNKTYLESCVACGYTSCF